MKKKFNWGSGIVLAVVIFIIGTLSMVSYFISLDFYLVSNDHYEEGVEYQQTIDKKQRAENLDKPVVVLFDESSVSIKLIFPTETLTDSLSGNVTFYRPNNPELDKKYKLNLNKEGLQTIPVGEFEKGRWKLTVEWEADSLTYIEEKNIFI
jgi:hypothetical protein